jgi:hypothetical protein
LKLTDDQSIFVSFPPAILGGLKPKFCFAEDGRSIGYYTPKKIKETERPDGLLAGHPNCNEGSKWHNMVEVEMKRQQGIQPNGKFSRLPSHDDYEFIGLLHLHVLLKNSSISPERKNFLNPQKNQRCKVMAAKFGSRFS